MKEGSTSHLCSTSLLGLPVLLLGDLPLWATGADVSAETILVILGSERIRSFRTPGTKRRHSFVSNRDHQQLLLSAAPAPSVRAISVRGAAAGRGILFLLRRDEPGGRTRDRSQAPRSPFLALLLTAGRGLALSTNTYCCFQILQPLSRRFHALSIFLDPKLVLKPDHWLALYA